MKDIIENFHVPSVGGEELVPAVAEEQPVEIPKIFVVAAFQPAFDRLLLKRLPQPKLGTGVIVAPQIAEEQSEYGYVIAKGADVEVPVGLVAKFSKHSGPEEIHFEDEEDGDEFILVYREDIRGWFRDDAPAPVPASNVVFINHGEPVWPTKAQVDEALKIYAVN